MAEQKRFLLGKEPFIRKADSKKYGTDIVMRDFFIALLPLIIFAWVKNGLLPYLNVDNVSFWTMIKPLVFIFMGGFTSWLLEFVAYKFFLKEKDPLKKVKNSFAPITGLILAMMLSVNTPIWVLIIGCFFATVIGKLLFGGFGYNIFNPALVGYLFISVAYYGVISKNGGYANPAEIEILAGATPMTNFASNPVASIDVLVGSYGSLWDFFLGTIPGSLAETSALLCVVSFIYLVIRKVINWRVPVIYVGTVFVLMYIIGAFNGYALDLRYALFGILSGGLMFGAVFMATEPVTTPKNPNGKVIFALFLGVLTVLFRYNGNMPEGVATSIITMNLFTVIIDRISAKTRVESKPRKIALTYSIIALMLIAISSYSVIGYAKTVSFTPEDVEISDVEQNLVTRNFEYTAYVGNKKVIITTDLNNDIISIDNDKYGSTEFIDAYKTKIGEYQSANYDKYPYVLDVQLDGENTILTIIAHRPLVYAQEVVFYVTIDNNNEIISLTSNSKDVESYTNPNYKNWSGIDPEDVLPDQIIEKQTDIDSIEVVATATQTSQLYIGVARLTLKYIEEVK